MRYLTYVLSSVNLRQFAGWSSSSNMHRRYVHLRGGESMKYLLKARGIVKDQDQTRSGVLVEQNAPHRV